MPLLALLVLISLVASVPASAQDPLVAPRACGGDAYSYGIVRERSAPRGVHAIGPQTFCAEVAREEGYPLGPIGIVIDPFSDRPAPVPPRRRFP